MTKQDRTTSYDDNNGNTVMTLCLLSEADFHRTNRGMTTGEYAKYIKDFYGFQAIANTKGLKFVVVVFNEASFNEYLETTFKSDFLSKYGHEPVTEAEFSKARAAWAHWFVTSDPQRIGF
jgi:hypothetical protein